MPAEPTYPVDIQVKKQPKQARSRATFDAIVQSAAWVLMHEGYVAATTNRIAEKAGVNIASLYEYFPNKDAIIAVLAERELTRYIAATAEEISRNKDLSEAGMVAHMIYWGVDEIQRHQGLLSTLMLDVPFVATLPSIQTAMSSAVTVIQQAMADDERVTNAPPEIEAWLLTRMCFNTALEMASNQIDDSRREQMLEAFVIFSFRMLFAREPTEQERRVLARTYIKKLTPAPEIEIGSSSC